MINVLLRSATRVLVLWLAWIAPPVAACEIDVPPMHFGTINPLHANATDSATSMTITCTVSTAFTIGLGEGRGTYHERHLQSVARTLAYNLYIDPSRTLVWGDGTAGTLTLNGSSDGTNPASYTIYARIPYQPQAEPGAYVDTIVITLSF